MPFLKAGETETGGEATGEELLEAAVEGEGVLAGGLARVHDDGDAEGPGVGIHAAVLDFPLLIETPGGLAGNAEGGVVQRPEEAAAGAQDGGDRLGHRREMLHVLNAEDGGGGVKWSKAVEAGCISHDEAHGTGGRVGAGFGDEGGRGIDAGDACAARGERAGKDALAATEVEDGFVGLRLEEVKRAGENDLLVEVGAFFTDEAVVPGGGFFPGGVGGG